MAIYTKGRARRSIFDTIVFRAAAQVATLGSYVVMVRSLSEHDFGVFTLLYAAIPVLSTVASLGLEQTLRRYQPEYLRANNTAAAARLVHVVARMRLIATVALVGAILSAWSFVAPLFKLEPYRAEFALFGLIIVLHFQTRVLQLSLASHMLHRYAVGMFTVLSIVKLVAYSIFAALGKLTLWTAIVADIVAYASAYAGMIVAHRRHCAAPDEQFRFDAAERKRLLRYGFFYNFNDAGSVALNVRAENFILAALMNPVAVGTYSFYSRLSIMAANLLPTRMFQNVVQPLFFAIRPEDAHERVPRYFTMLLNTSMLVQMPMLAYTAVYHREIVAVLFGGRFIEYSILMPVVFAFSTLNVIAHPVTLVAQYAEKASLILMTRLLGLYNVAALFLLIPRAGVFGAAVAVGSTEFMKNVIIWWFVRRQARWTNALAVIGSSVVVWGLFVVAGLSLKTFIPAPPIIHLIVGGVLAAAAALIYVRSPVLATADRTLLGTVMHGKEARLLRWIGVLRNPSHASA